MIPASPRSAFVLKAEDNYAELAVTQASDCMFLQRYHIPCKKVGLLQLWVDSDFVTFVNGPAQPQPAEVWEGALLHVLEAFRPLHIRVCSPDCPMHPEEGSKLVLMDGTSYHGTWNAEETSLYFKRRVSYL